MSFKKITACDFNKNVFNTIGNEWMLVGAKKADGSINAMTASWGGMGVVWGKNVCTVLIRPQRYTMEFVENADYITLSFFDGKYKDVLGFFGSKSGRDTDKFEKTGLTCEQYGNKSYAVKEASYNVIAKKLYSDEIKPDCFIDRELIDKWYKDKDFHTFFVCEITDILETL